MEKSIISAIKGGWRNKGKWKIYDEWEIHIPEQNSDLWYFISWKDKKFERVSFTVNECLVDPDFWKALGKTEGWRDVLYCTNPSKTSNHSESTEPPCPDCRDLRGWLAVQHNFVDHMAKNSSIDKFFKELIK